MNVRSWGNLGLSMLQASPLRTTGATPYQGKDSRKKENHAIINNVVDDILLNETKKISAVNHEAPDVLENDYDENDVYQVENTSLD